MREEKSEREEKNEKKKEEKRECRQEEYKRYTKKPVWKKEIHEKKKILCDKLIKI